MPYSSESGKAYIDKTISKLKRFAPALFKDVSVLDVGAGSGTYLNRYKNKLLHGHFTGIEIWQPYVDQFQLREKYDDLFVGDVADYFSVPRRHTTFTFLGDIVEHMTKEKAAGVIDRCLKNTDVLIVSIPIGYYPQDEYEGNPYEVHVTDNWTLQEALDFLGPNVVAFHQDNEIGVFILSLIEREMVKKALDVKVAVYSICKNEKQFIQRYLEWLEGFDIDQIVVCDTGSTDGTWDVLSFGAEITGCPFVAKQIHVSPWRFDDARNTALSLVWPEIDMCISLDIDEYLSENFVDELKALKRRVPQINRVNHRFSTIWDAANSTDHWHERIHSRAGYRWVLPVHEKLETHDQEFTEWLAHIRMYQKPDLTKSRSSYRPLLEQSVKERPNIWKSWSFLAGEYAGAGEYDKALDAINSALSIADSDKAYLQTQLGYFNEHLGKYQEAENNFINATFYAPLVREYKVKVADYLERRGQQALANVYLVQASQITTRTYGYEFDPACWTDEFNHRVEKAKSSQQ